LRKNFEITVSFALPALCLSTPAYILHREHHQSPTPAAMQILQQAGWPTAAAERRRFPSPLGRQLSIHEWSTAGRGVLTVRNT